jgi:hypothetical protein
MLHNSDSTSADTEIGIPDLDPSTSRILIRGNRALVVKVLWAALVLLTLGLYIFAIPLRYQGLTTAAISTVGRGEHQLTVHEAFTLSQSGIPITSYALYTTALEVATTAAYVLVGFLLFVRKSSDLLVAFSSLTLIMAGAATSGLFVLLVESPIPLLSLVSRIIVLVATICIFSLVYTFPDGRFVPSWMRWIALATVVALILDFVTEQPKGYIGVVSGPTITLDIIWIGSALYSQIYRYRTVSSPAQRQQTKWIILGLAILIIGQTLQAAIRFLVPAIGQPGTPHLLFNIFVQLPILNSLVAILVPLTFGLALFRYRLWDVDVYVNRSLVVGSLTLLLTVFCCHFCVSGYRWRSIPHSDSRVNATCRRCVPANAPQSGTFR